ncbi:unnamed protein product [Adineta ricciae]|uniref:WAP domain-containing protein n=1 Tax=Adineta ricciae TaxID=249248 RepID=A0A814INM3_ADIRI|nr:unnamed protein product [Adineta ricciae]CAF1026668.1 unnamed protein product [Adineta ricciae]
MASMIRNYTAAVAVLIIVSCVNMEKVCPRHGFIHQQQNCTATCSTVHDQCANGLKCCYSYTQSCGYHCTKPKDNIPKRGRCPTIKTSDPQWYVCNEHDCDVDYDCPGRQKCCSNICGSKVCIL